MQCSRVRFYVIRQACYSAAISSNALPERAIPTSPFGSISSECGTLNPIM